MNSKLRHALAGLALALILALFGASPSSSTPDSNPAAEGEVVAAASDDRTEVTTSFDADGSPELALFDVAEEVNAAPNYVRSPYANEAREILPEPEPTPAPEAAAAPPAPAPAPAGGVEGIIRRHFGPNTPKALAVARCESGLNPAAMSPGGGNHGLFQINNVHSGRFESVTGVPWSGRYDAEANTRFAKWLFDQSGWGPWACA